MKQTAWLTIARSTSALVILILCYGVGRSTAQQKWLPPSAVVDTPSFSIPFIVNENNYVSFAIHFGIHPRATTGIDPLLGEEEIPPIPPTFDARFGGPCGNPLTGCGLFLDLRPYSGPTQIDTYKVSFTADEIWGMPFIFSWPDLTPYYSGSVRLKMDLSGSIFDVDMKAQHSFIVSGLAPNVPPWIPYYAYIIAEGPLSGTTQAIVSTYGLANAAFEGIVHTPAGTQSAPGSAQQGVAGTTDVWFEYGQTMSYGSTTTHQPIPDASDMNVSEPFNPGSLPPNSRLHFRAVAQNTLGTFYGGDRIISNGTPPPEVVDSSGYVKYRTATYHDWADAKDLKDKRKAIKCKPDKVEFEFHLLWAGDIPNVPITFNAKFSTTTSGVISGSYGVDNVLTPEENLFTWDNMKEITFATHSGGLASELPFIRIKGWGAKGRPVSMKYLWAGWPGDRHPRSGTLPGNPLSPCCDSIVMNQPRLPMPNLHNVGEDIYGGVNQSPVNIVVGITGAPKGAHTVYHPKYKDVLKSFVKEIKGGGLYHTDSPRCLNTFDKSKRQIDKSQKGLPPDKHNNILFAEQLTLKLNIAASDSGIFPPGLGELIYSNGTPFDNETVLMIALQVDSFLSCPPVPPKSISDSSVYLKIVQDINAAFAGPMDTASWSCDKVICTGVKMLMDVPYLRANPNAVPLVFAPRPHSPVNLGPEEYALHQNYPNPFNPTTTIEFTLAQDAIVTLKIYNTLGQEVAALLQNEMMDEGTQEVEFDASRLASGVYYCRIVAQDAEGRSVLFSKTNKILLVR